MKDKEISIIAGLPRSGTSWVRDIVSYADNTLIYNEPDTGKQNIFKKLPFRIESYQERKDLQNILKESIKKIEDIKLVNHGNNPKILSRIFFYKIFKRKLKHIGLKTINASLKLGWIRKELGYPRTVFVIRNPFANVLSQANYRKYIQKGNPQKIRYAFKKYLKIHFGEKEGRLEAFDAFQLGALAWKYTNEFCINENKETSNFKIAVYEELCKNPENETRKIFSFLNLEFNDKVKRKLIKSTNPKEDLLGNIKEKRFFSTTKDPLITANKWKKELAEYQKRSIYEIVKESFLMEYWPDLNKDTIFMKTEKEKDARN